MLLAPTARADDASFKADLDALTQNPHRLAGTPEGREAGVHLTKRLHDIGVDEVLTLEFPMWQTTVERADLTVDGQTVPLTPLKPNLFAAVNTPDDGFTGPLLYVGQGTLEDYGNRSADGAIVVLDYASFNNWEVAFSLGAKAVVFLDIGTSTNPDPMQAGIPVDLVRLYARVDPDTGLAAGGVDLKQDRDEATVFSRVHWERTVGRNVLGIVRGTDPAFTGRAGNLPEVSVLAAPYDSYGNVPHLSPGARNAANAAGLLQAAAAIAADPPRRDTVIFFPDNDARAHQGTRVFYDGLLMPPDEHRSLVTSHDDEEAFVTAALELLRMSGLTIRRGEAGSEAANEAAGTLALKLKDEADWARDDLQQRVQQLRLRHAGALTPADDPDRPQPELDRLEAEMRRWDEIRRMLHRDELAVFIGELRAIVGGTESTWASGSGALARAAEEGDAARRAEAAAMLATIGDLETRITGRLQRRLDELLLLQRTDKQRDAIRRALSRDDVPYWITLHTTFNLGDATAVWGPVIGEWTPLLFTTKPPAAGTDDPGYYNRLLAAFGSLVGDRAEALSVAPATLRDTNFGWGFAPGRDVHGGAVAGSFGIYNMAVMTGYDARLRDGHPADTVANLAWPRLAAQARAAGGLLRDFADDPAQSQPRSFTANATSKRTTWSYGKPSGEYAKLQVTGGLSENRPASGAMIALWPGASGRAADALATLDGSLLTPAFEPVALQVADANGNFELVALREDLYAQPNTLGALFGDDGKIAAITTTDSVNQVLADAIRTDLIPAFGSGFTYRPTYDTLPAQLKVLRAAANSAYRTNRSIVGQLGVHSVFFIADQVVDTRTKVFQPMGMAVMGPFDEEPTGAGVNADYFAPPPHLTPPTAAALWTLNETRLARLRARGVTSADLETLHSQANLIREAAPARETVAAREGAFKRSQMISHRVYTPLRGSMDDLVHAVVVLLLLAIPFAFALERLLIGASSIYARIAGFVVMFLLTFGALYLMHPGFAIATTPVIIFLAFAIILLSSLVIYILSRKFNTELKAMQGQGGGGHELAISAAGTTLAAVGMGISTMRRRPMRTTLTAVTVVMLTFTILCFASFSTRIGVRETYVGPPAADAPGGVLLRKLDYAAIVPGTLDLLAGQAGEGGRVAAQWWAVPTGDTKAAEYYPVTLPDDGRTERVNAVMGLDPAEVERWPALAAALGEGDAPAKADALRGDAVYLPAVLQRLLGLEVGDRVLVQGVQATFAGTTDGQALQRLRHVDGESVLPVDFLAESYGIDETQTANEGEEAFASEVQKNFNHFSSDQVAIVGNDLARRLGADLHLVTVYPGPEVEPAGLARDLATLVVMPVWAAGDQGVQRMILTRLTEVAGGLRLAVPLLLGGLIIFGTLLGSIQDREKEIYTFSALGLSPRHVGILFFAEAAVYAVVGGMGGQLLAQLVALVANALTRAGMIDPISINYSSTNSLFAIGVVMLTVLVSALYPALRASKSANPGLQRAWKLPPADGDDLKMVFPFTVSAYDITGIVSFLGEHFRRHDDAGLGGFAASDVAVRRDDKGSLQLASDVALAPFDLGVTQHLTLTAVESEIPGVDEVAVHAERLSGAKGDWHRANRVFVKDLRRQFLLWRTLNHDVIEGYRMQTLSTLGEAPPLPNDNAEGNGHA